MCCGQPCGCSDRERAQRAIAALISFVNVVRPVPLSTGVGLAIAGTSGLLNTAVATTAGLLGSPDSAMICSATAPDTAMMAPTDRSMPRVAMTMVMPSATSMSGADWRRMSISAP